MGGIGKGLALGVVIGLAGCGPSVAARQFIGPDGDAFWWHIKCKGDNGLCFQKAGEVCLYGYDIQDRQQAYGRKTTSNAFVSGGNGTASGFATTISEPVTHGEMIVRCRPGPP